MSNINLNGINEIDLTIPGGTTATVSSPGVASVTPNTQAANIVLAGPTTGSPATPAYRALVAADLPLATVGAFGAVKPDGTTVTISGGVISAAGGTSVFSPFASTQTPPNTANFTNTNFQAGSSSTNKTGPPARTVVIVAPNGNIQEMLSNTAMPASPWTVDVAGILNTDDSTGFNSFGIVVQNGSGKLVFYQARMRSGAGQLVYEQWNSLTTFSSTVFTSSQSIGSYVAIRITDDGVNRKYYWSRNGIDYMLISSEATGTFTGVVTTVGIGFQANSSPSSLYMSMYNYKVSSSVLPQSGS